MPTAHGAPPADAAAAQAPTSSPEPAAFRWSIRVAPLVAMGTWWGLGLPYSLYAWLLDQHQLNWVLVCYGWEVPVCGLFGPFLFPTLWFRDIERRWQKIFGAAHIDVEETRMLERTILDYPMRVAAVLLATSLIGYGAGALQIRLFAQLPVAETIKILVLGLVTGLVGALFAFLYLEWLLAPLLRRFGSVHAVTPSSGRRVPLYAKVFACSLILTVTALLLLGTVFYSQGERVLEEQIGMRLLDEVRHIADDVQKQGVGTLDPARWEEIKASMQIGPSGYVQVVDRTGVLVAGEAGARMLADDGFRPISVLRMLTGGTGHLVDRVYDPRIVAFTPVAATDLRVVAVAYRRDFAGELDGMLARGGVVFVMALLLALSQGFLFSRRLTRPIEVVTDMASQIAQAPGGSWALVPVRTNDEVGELATAFNQMTTRLEDARTALERYSVQLEQRVAEATRNIASLYDVARATTSTLEPDDVLKLVAEKTLITLGLPRLVLLWHPPEAGDAVDAYAVRKDGPSGRLEMTEAIDLGALCPESSKPAIVHAEALAAIVPGNVAAAATAGEYAFTLPLVFKDQLLGVVLAGFGANMPGPDLDLAAALANQAAAALANAALFETARRHEIELRKLSGMRMQLQEETLRSLSRELHDGVGQVLTAIKMDLGMLERSLEPEGAKYRERIREVREQVTDLVQEIRNMSQLLRPSMLDDFGLIPTLQWLTDKFSQRTRITVDLRIPESDLRLPGAIEVLLYRVTQEALTNIVKHAKARAVEIDLRVGDAEVTLTIADDGVGFDVERFRRTPALGGVGLLGMRERVAHYHGHIDIRSPVTGGVRIMLTLPLDGTGSDSGSDSGTRGPVTLAG
ncbi:MAG TPA: ATP-binding protein [Candidatus Binatia bacterium]|jgi:signal transduction histidine kinase